MGAYVRRRALTTIPVLLGVSLVVFLMLHLLPGDPVMMMLTEHRGGGAPTVTGNITEEMYQNMRHQLGLDRPLPVQFLTFLGGVLRGDLGTSVRGGESVAELIQRNLPYTVQLAAASLGVAMALGFILGIFAGVKRGTWVDSVTMTIAAAGVSMPSFWLGILLLLVFAVHLNLVPAVAQAGDVQSLVLPAIALGFGASAGTVVIETVFGRPGIGHITVNGILERDFPVVQGVVLVSAVTYVFANFLVDLAYTWVDPRIRFGGGT
jgi:ABC-type dipeptide/oligopeptide/nickel transport system permease component